MGVIDGFRVASTVVDPDTLYTESHVSPPLLLSLAIAAALIAETMECGAAVRVTQVVVEGSESERRSSLRLCNKS